MELWNTVCVPTFSPRVVEEDRGRCRMKKNVSDSQVMRMLFSERKGNGVSTGMSGATWENSVWHTLLLR
jgi:hypothetical protein